MTSKAASSFWNCYAKLPQHTQDLADKNHHLWLHNPFHPSLRFKPFRGHQWSARVGDHYRAVGFWLDDHTFVWTWIGTHEDYNKL